MGGSPEVKAKGKDRGDGVKEEEVEFVNRRADGGYLLGVPGFGAGGGVGETVAVPVVAVPRTEEEREVDGAYSQYRPRYYYALAGDSMEKIADCAGVCCRGGCALQRHSTAVLRLGRGARG